MSLGVVVANYGDSGESSGSFLGNAALFPAVLSRDHGARHQPQREILHT
ncbi:hypothetical protein [Micromonospora echinospora]|nr:hypothetical protein [Micromonospora echinospora]